MLEPPKPLARRAPVDRRRLFVENYGDCCAVDDLAAKLGKTSGRLQPAVRKLVEAGYVTVEGEVFPIIYPTVAALRQQDRKLTVAQAEAILAKVRRG